VNRWERHDPIAYVLNGIHYKATGCGFRGGYRGHAKIPAAFRRLIHDSRYWFEEVIGPEGCTHCNSRLRRSRQYRTSLLRHHLNLSADAREFGGNDVELRHAPTRS